MDPDTGKSITELELEEAERARSAGSIGGILLYVLDDSAPWPPKYDEKDPAQIEKLARLKERIRQYTVTRFNVVTDLPFLIIRDVLARIRQHLGASSSRLRTLSLPEPRQLMQPIGMEFLTSADQHHLCGREHKVAELIESVSRSPITLLLGNSGSGKTSVIHAGVFPAAFQQGWLPIYTRPLGLPRADVARGIEASIFEGPASYRGSLIPLLKQVANAISPKRALLVIDQFEDILTAKQTEEAERLVEDLRVLRYVDDPDAHVLVSYRADLEARLGQFWQVISGSAQGLPRVYLGGVDEEAAWKSIVETCSDLKLGLDLSKAEAGRIIADLRTFSETHAEQAIYPPYIQMLIDHVWRTAPDSSRRYGYSDYAKGGAMEGITGGYLARQLTYANGQQGLGRAVLIALVRSYGVKAQRSLSEIAKDAGIPEPTCESLLERLIDLRLVRHVGGDYEVAHDFLAREIASKLVDSEEREFKRFRELLATKAAAFDVTRARLTEEELLILYKHKERVLPNDEELRVLVASWAREVGPALFWLLHAAPNRLLELLRLEEADEQIEREARATLVLLRRSVSKEDLEPKDWSLFRRYRLSFEMVSLLGSEKTCPNRVIEWALRNRQTRVRDAAFELVVRKILAGDTEWIPKLWKSSSLFLRAAYEQLIFRSDVLLEGDRLTQRSYRELTLLRELAQTKSRRDARTLNRDLKSIRPRFRTRLLARGLMLAGLSGPRAVVNQAKRLRNDKAFILLGALPGCADGSVLKELLPEYFARNTEEAKHFRLSNRSRREFYEGRANTFALPVFRLASQADLPVLREAVRQIQLTPSAQYVILALLRVGDGTDVLPVLRAIAQSEIEIRYWLQIEVAHAAEERMNALGAGIPPEVKLVLEKKDFWENPALRDRERATEGALPLKNMSNRTLFVRVAAHAAIGAAQKADSELLCGLVSHPFSLVARAAAIKLIALFGDKGMQTIQSKIADMMHGGNAKNVATALRDAEIHQFGLARLW